MRQLSLDDLSPLGLAKFEDLYEAENTRRPKCSRVDFGAGFVALAVDKNLYMYFDPDAWNEHLRGPA